MNISLGDDLRTFVRAKVESGEFVSEESVIVAALRRFRDERPPHLDDFIDRDFVDYCDREGSDGVTLDEVLRATSTITGSMAETIIEDERADRT